MIQLHEYQYGHIMLLLFCSFCQGCLVDYLRSRGRTVLGGDALLNFALCVLLKYYNVYNAIFRLYVYHHQLDCNFVTCTLFITIYLSFVPN